MKAIIRFVARHPWIYVILAFLLLIGAWLTIILIAAHTPTPEFEVTPPPHHR